MPVKHAPTTTGSAADDELLQAQAELWCHALAYLKSIALRCAIKLRIPTTIHRCGGAASLPELLESLPVPASKRPCLSRLMKMLAASGIFRELEAGVYSLTPVSRLLVEDDADTGGSQTCQSPFALLCSTPFHFRASQLIPEWLVTESKNDDGTAAAETPLMMASSMSLYDFVGCDTEFGKLFNQAMSVDSRFTAEILMRECSEVFAGVTSLVDVGGGDGTTAKAIVKAFPHVRCSVLELPHQVVDSVPLDDGTVQFVAGDMMDFIPPADVVLLKFVLHNWTDEDCVGILRRAKEAVSTREPKGKARSESKKNGTGCS
ncbi:hypothetical protein QOZ80_8AG0638310 [Eleusine coracana subsp. coracana]|nr:hypothetical protein QOZ80_8AG0638310 [Eleusine coracana subsp. coracana]